MAITVDQDIQLEALCSAHIEQLFSLVDNDRQFLGQWLSWVSQWESAEDCQGFVKNSIRKMVDGTDMDLLVLFQGQIVGMVSLNMIDSNHHRCQIGYWLSQKANGKGIMTRAVGAALDYAFEKLQMNRVVICSGVDNQPSNAIVKRLGFSLEGVLRQHEYLHGRYIDHQNWGLLQSEWQQQKAKPVSSEMA